MEINVQLALSSIVYAVRKLKHCLKTQKIFCRLKKEENAGQIERFIMCLLLFSIFYYVYSWSKVGEISCCCIVIA
jgi:hypothetical protein